MLTVGSLLRFGILQLPVQRICPAVFNRKSPLPGHTCSAPRSGGLSAVCYHMLPIRTLSDVLTRSGLRTPLNVWTLSGLRTPSGVRTLSGLRTLSGPWTSSGVRRLSGGGGDGAGEAGWYNNLSDSAPVHLCEHFLVSVQQVSGLPWWLSIVMSTLCVRTLITLPLAAYQMVIIAKVEVLQVEISELAKRLRYEVSVRALERGWTEKQSRFQFQKNLRRIVSQLYVRDNCHPFKASLALRNLSLDQSALQSNLKAGGVLWFSDLTLPDSTWILPVCLGLTNLLVVEVFSLQRVNPSRVQRFVTNSIRAFSVLMVPIAASVPSSMALYWFSSSLVGFSHNLLLRSPAIHKILKLKTQRSEAPYRDLLTAFVSKYCK
uniref:Cytochrome c oxidase assembly factor COX18 n=1 Tax=Sparus aurata TaxID=8175 RepID=A0A671TTR7_SPAAU